MIHFKPFRFGKTETGFLIGAIALILLTVGIATNPAVSRWYEWATNAWTEWALRYGYAGAFLASFIGSITVVFIFPYTLVIFFLASSGLNPLYLALLMGFGTTIGQLSGWVIGVWGSRWLKRSKPAEYDALERMLKHRPGVVRWLLFLFAVTPLPDDLLFIPLGMLRYSLWNIFWPTLLGKTITGFFVSYSGHHFTSLLRPEQPSAPLAIASQVGTLFAVGIIIYLIVKLDWTRMMHRMLDGHEPLSKEAV